MDLYLELSRRLAEKQMIEKIIFELEYNFLFLKKEKIKNIYYRRCKCVYLG